MNGRTLRLMLCTTLTWAAPLVASATTLVQTVTITAQQGSQTGPYELSVGAVSVANGQSVVGPDGTIFTEANKSIAGLSQADIFSRFAGTWTINDLFQVPAPGTAQQHQFIVPAASLTGEFPSVPVVVSPAEGATVPRVFRVQWDDDSPTRSAFKLQGLGQSHVGYNETRIADDDHEISVVFEPLETLKAATFTANGGRQDEFPAATPLVAGPKNTWLPVVQRWTLSLPRHFNVVNVPEPSTAVLLCASALWLSLGARARRSTRRVSAAR